MCKTSQFKISIPTPCHEDWNKMTPNEKGAFCGSCQKSVVDFSNKSIEEIDAIIRENTGQKICGRFKTKQLEEVKLEVPLYMLPKRTPPLHKFAYILLMVFGTTLFSCTSESGKTVGELVAVERPLLPPTKNDGFLNLAPIDTLITNIEPPTIIDYNNMIMGDMAYDPIDTIESIPTPPEPPIEHMMGAMMYIPNDTTNDKPIDVPVINDSIIETTHTLGGICVRPIEPIQALDTIIETPQKKKVETILIETPSELKMDIYPNPGKDETNIRYTLTEKNKVKISLFDLSGKEIKILINDQVHYPGTYVTHFDLSGLGTGNYICVFVSGNKKVTSKLAVVR